MKTRAEIVKEQILEIRASGVTNMLDIPRVQQEAERLGFTELNFYLAGHKEDYWNFILTGEMYEI